MNTVLLIIALLCAFLAYVNFLSVEALKLHIERKGYDLPTTEEAEKLLNEVVQNLFN